MKKPMDSPVVLDVTALQSRLRAIAAEREWERFHTPKNLAVALSVEAGELLERFTWLTDDADLEKDREAIEDEMADVLYYLLRLADRMNTHLPRAFERKLAKSLAKYPVELARGNARKYTDLGRDGEPRT
jgi:NTP pyrophosphatase (non-canonical NTP hydrolase)